MKIRLKRHSSNASNSRRSPILLNPRTAPLKNNPFHASSSATVPTLIPTISQILPIHVTVEEVAVDNIRKKGAGSISGWLDILVRGLRFRFQRDFRIRSGQLGLCKRGTKGKHGSVVETHLSKAIKALATENDATGRDCSTSFLHPSLSSVGYFNPATTSLRWTIMREKPYKHVARRTIGRRTSPNCTAMFTVC